jgi:hypothetical protein
MDPAYVLCRLNPECAQIILWQGIGAVLIMMVAYGVYKLWPNLPKKLRAYLGTRSPLFWMAALLCLLLIVAGGPGLAIVVMIAMMGGEFLAWMRAR